MPPHVIEIFVNDGALSYDDKDGLIVQWGDQVRWICKTHDYGIQFTNNASPFEEEVLSLSKIKGQETDGCTVKRPTVRQPRRRRVAFKYAVSVHIPGSNKPIVTDDPVIIVEDGGG